MGSRRPFATLSRSLDHLLEFSPTIYKRARIEATLSDVVHIKEKRRRTVSAFCRADATFPQTRTVSQTLRAMFGLLPAGKLQLPHRHESVAVDFVADCEPGVYTLIGQELDESRWIKKSASRRVGARRELITPPGYWHSHHNESGADAHVLPIQDVGLQEYLRTLEIIFSHIEPNSDVHITDLP